MTRRRLLKDICIGGATWFVSRNNDVDGYWAIGKLHRHALTSDTTVIRMDFLEGTIDPPAPQFLSMMRRGSERAALLAARHKLEITAFTAEFELQSVTLCACPHFKAPVSPWSLRFTIRDDRGKDWSHVEQYYSWPHDPALEGQRTGFGVPVSA